MVSLEVRWCCPVHATACALSSWVLPPSASPGALEPYAEVLWDSEYSTSTRSQWELRSEAIQLRSDPLAMVDPQLVQLTDCTPSQTRRETIPLMLGVAEANCHWSGFVDCLPRHRRSRSRVILSGQAPFCTAVPVSSS